jgi:hypothetical protein
MAERWSRCQNGDGIMYVLLRHSLVHGNFRPLSPAMHRAWPRLLQRMNKQGPGDVMTDEDRQLAITARTWFCLYLFEHQKVAFLTFTIAG